MVNDGLYSQQKAISAIYRAELAEGLARLGYGIERTHADGRFEIASVSREVIERRVNRRASGAFTLPGLLKIKVARNMVSPVTGPEITVVAKPASRRVKVQMLSGLKRMADQGAARPPSGGAFRCRV